MGVFTILFVPETKGVPIEAIEDELFKKHWFWGRVMAKTYAAEAEDEARAAVPSEGGSDDLSRDAPVKVTLAGAQEAGAPPKGASGVPRLDRDT
jgi:hypothetical protein